MQGSRPKTNIKKAAKRDVCVLLCQTTYGLFCKDTIYEGTGPMFDLLDRKQKFPEITSCAKGDVINQVNWKKFQLLLSENASLESNLEEGGYGTEWRLRRIARLLTI